MLWMPCWQYALTQGVVREVAKLQQADLADLECVTGAGGEVLQSCGLLVKPAQQPAKASQHQCARRTCAGGQPQLKTCEEMHDDRDGQVRR